MVEKAFLISLVWADEKQKLNFLAFLNKKGSGQFGIVDSVYRLNLNDHSMSVRMVDIDILSEPP